MEDWQNLQAYQDNNGHTEGRMQKQGPDLNGHNVLD
jgi:hypothetical protein